MKVGGSPVLILLSILIPISVVGLLPEAQGSTATFEVLHTFAGGGIVPRSGLVQDEQGNFYGSTVYGGLYGFGAVFRIDSATGAMTVLHSFNNPSENEAFRPP